MKSNFPFTEQSTLRLSDKQKLPRGVVFGCLLHPKISEVFNYFRVSRIWGIKDDAEGHLSVVSDTGSTICEVVFYLAQGGDYLIGRAVDSYGNFCGSMTVSSAMIPFFYSTYNLSGDSLIFTPSAIRPMPVTQSHSSGRLLYEGRDVSALDTTDVDASLGAAEESAASQDPPYISKIIIKGAPKTTLTGKHVVISTDCGGIRVVQSGDELLIGRFCDL